jgi:hypothetical protein
VEIRSRIRHANEIQTSVLETPEGLNHNSKMFIALINKNG